MGQKFSRRDFLKAAAVLLAGGCLPEGLSRSTPTPPLLPTVTPLPAADSTVKAYLTAWARADYASLYSLMTPAAQAKIKADAFAPYCEALLQEATILSWETQQKDLQPSSGSAKAALHTSYQTALFGKLDVDQAMELRFEGGQWLVHWSPALLLPQLGWDVILTLIDEKPNRGNIYDITGHGLAVPGTQVLLGVVPERMKDSAAILPQIAALTGLSLAEMQARIDASRPDWFVELATLSFEESLANDSLISSLPGVERRERTIRNYPEGNTASHLLGYMAPIPAEKLSDWQALGYRGDELVGSYGVEGWGESLLAGRRGGRLITLTADHQQLAEVASSPAKLSGSLALTIDTATQKVAEELLEKRRGSIVVMDVHSGAVKAMASYPRFDPNLFADGVKAGTWQKLNDDPNHPLVNRAAQGSYPPGSIFKVITLSAALEKLGLSPSMTFHCSGTWTGLGESLKKTCWNKEGHGTISLYQGLVQSCDVVFYELGMRLYKSDPAFLSGMARSYGLGQPCGLKGIEETGGVVPDNDWKMQTLGEGLYLGDMVNMAIGQGDLLASPLQLTRAMAAVANGGTLLRPRLLDKIQHPEGEEALDTETVGQLPLKKENLALLQKALAEVVAAPQGTAHFAFKDWPYTAAGKTGTAESGQAEPHAWFVGYAPAESPQVAIAVMIENAGEGSEEAAPIWRKMAEFCLGIG